MSADRIAVVYDCLYPFTTGGGERQYRGFAERMTRAGRHVEYLTARQWDGPAPRAPFGIRPVAGRLRLYGPDGVRSAVAALRFAAGVFAFLLRRRRRYDAVVVSALPVFNVFAARLALAGTPVAVIADYLEVWGRRQWVEYAGRVTGTLAWALQRLAIAVTPTASCHSRLSADRLRGEGFGGTVLVSPGLIDPDGAGTRTTVAAAEPPYALYAGRHIADKRVETLPAAVADARRRVPDLGLVILGEGTTTGAVRAAVEAAGVADRTRMPGFVDDDELDRLFARAACVVNPSRREGYGLVAVEAAGHGVPVVLVADPSNAATELVENGVNGFVAASASPHALGAAIAAAVEGGDALRATTLGWYRDAVQTRSLDRTVSALLEALDTMADRRRRSPRRRRIRARGDL